jgi:DNA primase
MIKNKEEIKAAASVYEVVREYVDLTKRGVNYIGNCPFHNEKTPSFTVNDSKGIYKCFGCGASGDSIQFLMDHKGYSFHEAVEQIAKISKVVVEYDQNVDRDKYKQQSQQQKQQKTGLQSLLLEALLYYFKDTWNDTKYEDVDKVSFAGREYTWATIKAFTLSFAGGKNMLKKWATDKGCEAELKEMGLLSESERGAYDTFRERSLFPIFDHLGNPVGVGGRKKMDDDNKQNPKYINSKGSIIYDKSASLYGLAQHLKHIRNANRAILVEGYTDVISFSDYDVKLTLATCGTALSATQAKTIKRYADEVLILRDGDDAGREAAIKDIEMLISQGLHVKIAFLPEGEDPDSFIRKHKKKGWEEFLRNDEQDALVWRIMKEWDKTDVFKQEKAFEIAGQLMSYIESVTLRENYLRKLTHSSQMGAVKKQLKDRIEHYDAKRLEKKSDLSDKQERDIIQYGLYEKSSKYFVSSNSNDEGFAISNFIVRPILLIIGAQASQRLVEIKNEYNKSYIINCDSYVFTSLVEFKKNVERMGNFLFTGKPEFYERVKAKVYQESRDAFPIQVMGLHREGFYTWGNGISMDGNFKEVDEYGVVEHDGTRYFLPAFSRLRENIKSDDMDEEFEFEKKFRFYQHTNSIDFAEWSMRMEQVHGFNGAMAVAFACASLFRDIIFQKFQFFPHLNAFGPSGSGKSFLARSVMALFGKSNEHDPFNLSAGTPVAFKRRLAQVSNGIVFFDEYSNQIDYRRIEALKGAYDGAGHEKGIASQDNRTKTTKVRSAIVVVGQEQMTKDIALFKRTISLNTKTGRNTPERQQRAKELKQLEESGQLTHITHYLLQYREQVVEHFSNSFETARALINAMLDREGHVVEDRIVNNHIIPVAVIDVLMKHVDIGFNFKSFVSDTFNNIVEQSNAIYSEDELSIFWRIVEYLHQKGLADHRSGIHHYKDIIVQEKTSESYQNELNKKEKKDSIQKTYPAGTQLLYIRFATVHPEYQERHARQRGKNGLDLQALQYYLRTSDAYEGQKRAKKFKNKSYSCYVFRLDALPIELPMSIEVEEPLEAMVD